MPDWKSPEELQKDGLIFGKFMHSLFGLYAYEWLVSLHFEWDFLTGKKKFRWPMIFYFANRYLMLLTMVGVLITLDSTTEVNCRALYTFSQLAGDASVGLASINLSIRTMAIWSQNRYIIGLLILLIIGHWSLILQGIQLKAAWVPGVGCVIIEFNNKIFAAIFIYSMCFDFIVFTLNTYKLVGLHWNSGTLVKLTQSRLSHMIFSDGLIYFFIAFAANLVATIFMLLNLNLVMAVIFNVPAAIFSTIAACRAVRRLTKFSYNGPQMINNATTSTGSMFKRTATRPGVHVQMETFTHQEDRNVDFFIKSGKDSDGSRDPDLEAGGKH